MLLSTGLLLASAPDCDIWWHLQVGRDICRDGVWPSPDIYSYTTDRPWVIHSWLADCFFYLLWAGAESVYTGAGDTLLKAFRLILLVVFALVVYLWAKHSSQNETLSVVAALCAAALSWAREIRPFLFTPLFLLYLYSFFKRREPSHVDWFVIPLCMLLWANLHGGFAIGGVLMLCALAAQAVAPLLSVERYHSSEWILISLVAVAATFINPEPAPLVSHLSHVRSNPSLDWRPLTWWFAQTPLGTLNYVTIYVAVLTAWVYGMLRQRPERSVLLSAGFMTEIASFVLSVLHIRLVWMLVIPLLASCERLRGIIPAEKKARWTPLLVLFLVLFLLEIPPPHRDIFRLPKESVDCFTQAGLHGNVFAPWQWGGYITWKTDKKAQVFVDTRIQPFTMQEIVLPRDVQEMPARHLDVLADYGTEFVIMPIDDRELEWEMLAKRDLITILHKNHTDFVARVHTDRIREGYAGIRPDAGWRLQPR